MSEVDKEYLRERERLWEIKGNKCIYCGAEATELHHIVPRHMGGDNRLSNIVPLCRECHCKAHSKRSHKTDVKYGRRRLPKPNNFDEVADRYLEGQCSMKEALELTGLKNHTFYKFLHEFAEAEGREHQVGRRRPAQAKEYDVYASVIETLKRQLEKKDEQIEECFMQLEAMQTLMLNQRKERQDNGRDEA